MTFLGIYSMVSSKIWGDSTPPAIAPIVLQGEFGIISNVHRRIQVDRNYWFMEKSTTISVLDGTSSYSLPTGFKEIVDRGLRFIDGTTGQYYEPLSPLQAGDSSDYFRGGADEVADYPLYYEIYGGNLMLYPEPDENTTLHMRYYGFLDRPTTFATATDLLTQNGYDVIIAYSASEMCKILEEFTKAQVFEQEGIIALELLKQQDHKMRRAEIKSCRYRGF